MKILHISDLNGILLNSKREVTDYTVGIINRCIEAGMLFSVATARMSYGCDYRLKQLNLQTPVIPTDSVFICDFNIKKYLHVEKTERDVVREVIGVFEENKKSCFVYLFHDEQISICYGDDSLKAQEQYHSKRALESCERVYRTDNFRKEMEQGDAVYFALTGTEQKLEPIYKSLGQARGIHYTCYLSIHSGFYRPEVFSYKASKRHVPLRLKDMLGCGQLVAFRDNHNNMPTIKIADRSYAPANALEVAKQAMANVLEDCDHDSAAKFLRREPGI